MCPSILPTVPNSKGRRAGGRFYDDKALFQMHQHPCVADVSAIKSSWSLQEFLSDLEHFNWQNFACAYSAFIPPQVRGAPKM